MIIDQPVAASYLPVPDLSHTCNIEKLIQQEILAGFDHLGITKMHWEH